MIFCILLFCTKSLKSIIHSPFWGRHRSNSQLPCVVTSDLIKQFRSRRSDMPINREKQQKGKRNWVRKWRKESQTPFDSEANDADFYELWFWRVGPRSLFTLRENGDPTLSCNCPRNYAKKNHLKYDVTLHVYLLFFLPFMDFQVHFNKSIHIKSKAFSSKRLLCLSLVLPLLS